MSWLADLIYLDGKFQPDLALIADEAGRIVRFSSEPADLAKAQRLPGKAILPGLVNAHSHSFQRAIRGRTEHRSGASQDTFWTWREAMYSAANRLSPDDIYVVARMAFLEMLLSGITTVREFHYLHHAADGSRYEEPNLLSLQVIRAAQELGLRIELLRTAYARAGWRQPSNPKQSRFITPSPEMFIADTEALRKVALVGVAPHSVRALPLRYLLEVIQYARANGLPVDMHVAEQPAEIEACLVEHGRRPVELLEQYGILDPSFTAVHAIHVTREEIGFLGRAGARVCACPTTERNLGDGPVPADSLAEAGVAICFGSDSNVQIDLLEDARSLEYHLRMKNLVRSVLAPKHLLNSAAGRFEIGRPADFFTVELNDVSIAGAGRDSLLSNIVFSTERTAVRDVFVNGKQVVQDGHHPLEEEVIRSFVELQRRLWE
jgi:formimidoylglutamate deiminase